MKHTLIILFVFVGAVLFFAYMTGIATEVWANGFNWLKIVSMAKGDDNMIWAILPIGCVLGLFGYWIFNRE